ncbi:MAG: class I SAM-dependent methyltransferase [Firmicutes bacterium]|nr:class I SAM-dependent methyltransferase [Bacillota bacterium]
MNKKEIIRFFDERASQWDAEMVFNASVVEQILDNAHITKGIHVLDVACGTGVLFPEYLKRDVASITAIDISSEMVRIAREKFPQIDILCGDAERFSFPRKFDRIMIYNAFPHFPNPEALIRNLSRHLASEGTITIAHSMSREALQRHHADRADQVSVELPELEILKEMLAPYVQVETAISNERMYQITGTI